jgi:hypothetical protein
MRHLFTGLIAAVAVMATAPAFACGYTPCGAPQVYVAPVVDYGCNPCGGGGWTQQRLIAPEQQYYYVNQGPTYTGPGNFAPVRTYEEGSVSGDGYGYARHHYGYRQHYGYRPHYGYQPHYGYRHHGTYAPRFYPSPRMSYHHGYAPAPYHYGRHVLRRYY